MLRQILIAALFIASLVSCNSRSALNYSEAIVSKERSLTKDIENTESKVSTFLLAGQFDSVAAAGGRMEKKVTEKIDEINALPLPDAKGAGEFKKAALDYFRYIKSIYTTYKNMGLAKTDEERRKIMTDLQDQVAEKSAVVTKMQQAQRKYAKDNGFKVQ